MDQEVINKVKSQLHEACEILEAEVSERYDGMDIIEFNKTPTGRALRRIRTALETIEENE